MTNSTNLHCRLHCRLHCHPDIRFNVSCRGFGGATNVRVNLTNCIGGCTGCTVGCTVGCTASNPRIHWAFALLVQPVAIFLLKVGRNKNWLCMVVRMYGYRVCIEFGAFLATGCTVPPKQHCGYAAKTILPVAAVCCGLTFPKGAVMKTKMPPNPPNARSLNQVRLPGLTKPGSAP